MPTTKKALCSVRTFTVTCPHCRNLVTDPDYDSYQWEIHEVKAGAEYPCFSCGNTFALPVRVADNRLYPQLGGSHADHER